MDMGEYIEIGGKNERSKWRSNGTEQARAFIVCALSARE